MQCRVRDVSLVEYEENASEKNTIRDGSLCESCFVGYGYVVREEKGKMQKGQGFKDASSREE